jgi:hypothetical protein
MRAKRFMLWILRNVRLLLPSKSLLHHLETSVKQLKISCGDFETSIIAVKLSRYLYSKSLMQ